MSLTVLFQRSGALLLVTAALAVLSFGQRPGSTTPRQEKLLNGLKVLMWNNPSVDQVTVKVRIHAGSAFDPQGKEGVMKLLADSIFPDQNAFDFFKEDLGGSLEVVSNYDYIQVNATAKPDKFLEMMETLAQQVTDPEVDKATTEQLKTRLISKLEELEKDPAYVADQAVAKRLFGSFPYGRPQFGTIESVKKIDFADLRFNKDRLFSADNASVAITGNFSGDYAFKAARRLFGSWLKADKKIPSTFKQPDAPDTARLDIPMAGITAPEARYAFRGLARSDKDYAASEVLSQILKARFRNQLAGSSPLSNYANILPGSVVLRASTSTADAPKIVGPISNEEFTTAKAAVLAEYSKRPVADLWLDADTYKLNVADEAKAFQNVTLADVQRVADNLGKNPVVSVLVSTPAEQSN